MAGKKRVLYVEDNADNRMLIRRLLMAEGFELLEAANAEQMWAILQTQRPDLILMDLHLPGIDGFTLTHQLTTHPRYGDIPVVALTADVLRDTPQRCAAAGCVGYITKPIDVDTFVAQLRRYL
ncbi:MAG: response regulator [Chloroflexi bacterium]|nr:response regulator [Chloroflexota bacterium]